LFEDLVSLAFLFYYLYNFTCRGDKFRQDFSKLGELRSLISANVMALTATATSDTLKVVKERLSLQYPAVIGLSPNVPNVFYSAAKLPKLEVFCHALSTALMRHRVSYPKTIIFCRSYGDCGDIYHTLEIMMGSSFTEPFGYPKGLHWFRLVDMYTRASKRKMKQKVLESFVSMTSRLRVVIATTAFSLGIDCPNIRKVIHYGTQVLLKNMFKRLAGLERTENLPELVYFMEIHQKMYCHR